MCIELAHGSIEKLDMLSTVMNRWQMLLVRERPFVM
jgi:hypothetical protein